MADTPSVPAAPFLRTATLILAGTAAFFLIYSFYALWTAPSRDNTGMQMVGIVPMGFVFLVLSLPALMLALNRMLPVPALILAVLGLGVQQWLWWGMLVKEMHLS